MTLRNSLSMTIAVLLTGVVAGLCGMGLALLLHFIQHVMFGYSLEEIISPESFLTGVTDAHAGRRILVLAAAGIVAGAGWWLLARYGQPKVSIDAAVNNTTKPMPFFTTIIHALLQIITVAMGSPLGREVAPREFGALSGRLIARALHLADGETKTLIACGAGAGLAAVYNVPLAGALFILEVLLVSCRWQHVLPAIITCSLASIVAASVLGNGAQYQFTGLQAQPKLLLWSILSAPFLGYAAYWFRRLTRRARSRMKPNWQLPLFCLISFTLMGVFSVWFPQLPGNGKGPVQLALNGDMGLILSIALFLLKGFFILAVLRSGAAGGLLTPGLMMGVLLANIMYCALSGIFNLDFAAAAALIGGAAFLAASMQMPLTAIVLLGEFTHLNYEGWVPVIISAAISFSTCLILEKRS